jgi:sRNA-binding regulator protein Hfq
LYILIRLYDLYSIWIRSLALQYMWYKYASSSSVPWDSHKPY